MALYRLEVSSFAFPVMPLKRLILGKPQYGANERGVDRTSRTIPRYVRITDIDEYGRLRDGLGVAAENVEAQYLLNDGDLLFARSGNTVGKAYLHASRVGESFLFAGYMIRLRADKTQVMPEYVFLCTQLEFYKHWVAATQRATGQPNINAEEYRSLEIPIPNLAMQASLVQRYKAAIHSYESSAAKASDLLVGIDDFLLAALGITLPPEPENTLATRIFAAQRRELEQRFDPAYFSSRFSRIQHALETISHSRLREVAVFSSEQWDQVSGFGDDFPYLEISAINTATGEVSGIDSIPKENAPSRAKMLIREGDILLSTTRPNRGAITFVDSCLQTPLIASTGFSIIRHVIESKISKEFLLILLRSRLCLMQLEQRSSGGNYPAITQSELGRILIPVIAPCAQEKVVTHVKALQAEAKRLRAEAQTALEAAKRRIEAMLLGEPA